MDPIEERDIEKILSLLDEPRVQKRLYEILIASKEILNPKPGE